MAVSKRLRYEVLRRDNHTCRYCGATAPDVPLRIDHVVPQSLGGTDAPDNLVTACQDCNSGKSSATVDSTVVADVADDALRWAAAMEQAAAELQTQTAPKRAYRDAFQQAWNEWTWEHDGKRQPFDLPDGWKTSLDNFREAGLPQDVWPDIIEKTITNKTVKADNLFRYACGIAWRMVRELQERASVIVGVATPATNVDSRAAVLEATFGVWRVGRIEVGEPPSAQEEDAFRKSLDAIPDWDLLEPGRIVEAAQRASFLGGSDIGEALRDLDRARVWAAWTSAWPTTYVAGDTGDPWVGKHVGGPSEDAMEQVRKKIRKLLDAEVPAFRVAQAATHAGFHKSTVLYRGLTDEELEASGEERWAARARAAELWRSAFSASGQREPSAEETSQFLAHLERIGNGGGFCVADVYDTATAAGAYQDPDLTTCLARNLSVFEAAARPLACAA